MQFVTASSATEINIKSIEIDVSFQHFIDHQTLVHFNKRIHTLVKIIERINFHRLINLNYSMLLYVVVYRGGATFALFRQISTRPSQKI